MAKCRLGSGLRLQFGTEPRQSKPELLKCFLSSQTENTNENLKRTYIFQNNYQILAFCIRLHFVFDFKDVVYLDIHIWCSTESHIDVQYKIWVLKQNQNHYVNWRPQCTFNSSDVDFINRRAVKKIIHRPDLPHRQLDDQPCYYIFTDRVAVRTEQQQGMLFWDP